MLRVLTFTDLYPSPGRPRHGIFVENRLRKLVETGAIAATVVAPIALRLAPSRSPRGKRIPPSYRRHGVDVYHPRFPVIPKLSNWVNPVSLAIAALPVVDRLRKTFDFDVIDAHFFYPAGVAAILLGRWLGKPVVITARGSDVNLHTQFRIQRAWIRWAANQADAVVTVSSALRATLENLGVQRERVTVVRNGVDLEAFRPQDRTELRRQLGWSRPTLLAVGNLVPEKGHELVIEALAALPDVDLVLVGSGPEEQRLRGLASRMNVAQRVTWIPYLPPDELARRYAAADATVLASSREGMPNVVLESIACGTRVIASDVGGTAEVVSSEHAGVLLRERSAAAIAEAYLQLRDSAPGRTTSATRAFAEQFGWAEPIATLQALLERVSKRAAEHPAPGTPAKGGA